jgi:hypothetical protein
MARESENDPNMNKTKVELPDGRLITLEGSNAEGIAALLMNHCGLGPVANSSDTEEPLELPVMTFERRVEEPLDNPAIRAFERPRRDTPAPVWTNVPVSNAEEPLALPVMEF